MPEITVTETQRERLATIQADIEAAYIDTYGHVRLEDTIQYLLDTYTPPSEQSSDVAYERIATAEFQHLQAVATDVEGVPGSGIDAATMRGELLSTLGVEEFAERLAALEESDAETDGTAPGAAPETEGTDAVETDSDADQDSEDSDTAAEDADAVETGSDTDQDSEDTDTAAEDADQNTEDSDADGVAEADEDGDASTEESSTADAPPDAGDGADSSDVPALGDDSDEDADGSDTNAGGPGSIISAANQLLNAHDDKWREGGSDAPYEVDLPDGTTEKVRTKDDVKGLLFKHY